MPSFKWLRKQHLGILKSAMLRTIVVTLGYLLSLAHLGTAQTFRGGITGFVTDSSGAAVPGAAVRIDNPATGFTRTIAANDSGEYSFPDLAVGTYNVTVSMQGFETKKTDNVEVAISKITNINVQLGIAQQQQVVEVSAAAVNLETTSSGLASVVNTAAVLDLPMNGRNFTQMVKLSPGVTATGNNVNGMRSSSNNWQIDGADNNDTVGNGVAVNQGGVSAIAGALLPIDAIDQFSVQTNAESDMGRNSGSNINMVIKSGTNDIHGSAYYFNRNEALAEPSPLLPSGSKPQRIRNSQPGFSLGGPVIKNNTFFFVSGEIQLAEAAESIEDTLPSGAWVSAAQGVLAKYGVPVNPVSLNLLTLWPASSRTGPATTNNYLANGLNTYNSYNGIIKIDHRFNDRHSFFVRYLGGVGTQIADYGSHLKDYFLEAPTHVHNFSAVENDVFSPRLVNQITAGVMYFKQTFNDFNPGFNPIALGLNTGLTSAQVAGVLSGAPTLTITGFDYVGQGIYEQGRTDGTGHLTDNLSYTRGRHQLKFGGEFRKADMDFYNYGNARGNFTFDGTRGPWSADSTVSSNLRSLADFLAGTPSNSSGALIVRGLPEPIILQNSGDWWAHDTFQVSPQLSLNFGVRYTYLGVLHDTANLFTNFIRGQGFVQGPIYKSNPLDFSPRFGFAYAPKWAKRLVLRGGYGIFYDVPGMGTFTQTTASNGAASGVTYNPGGPNPVYTLAAQNVVFQPGVSVFGGATPQPPFGAFSVNPDFKTPYAQNYNLNVQVQLSRTTLLQTGYVGNVGRHLLVLLDINQLVNGVRPLAQEYPQLSAINQVDSIANSSYNSLQTSLRQQLWKGLSANFNYTWSHAIDDASSGATPEDSYNLALDRGASTFDVRQVATGFFTYQLPQLGRFAPRLTGGWQFNALTTFSSGPPVNITAGKNISATGENKDRVNLVPNVDPYLGYQAISGSAAVRYLNPAAFSMPAAGTYGNLGRDTLYAPGFNSIDFSIFKRTRITERIMSELRIEVFNIFNVTNWAAPNSNFSSGSFGELTQTKSGSSAPGLGVGEPRNVQLGLKLIF